jgi:hypothetical protein
VCSNELITKLANFTVEFPDSLVCDFETALPRVVGRARMGLCRRQSNRPSGVDFGEEVALGVDPGTRDARGPREPSDAHWLTALFQVREGSDGTFPVSC